MTDDEVLADRVRAVVSAEPGLTEKRMFGGLAFLIEGHMAVATSGQGGLIVRVDPEELDALVDGSSAEPMVMRGRPMRGWVLVPEAGVRDEPELERWVRTGVAFAGSLPPKS